MSNKWIHISVLVTIGHLAWIPSSPGGEILSGFGDAEAVTTDALNNDDYAAALDDNPNLLLANGPRGAPREQQSVSNFELFFAVGESMGTTEYTIDLSGQYLGSENEPFTLDNRFVLELGFGTGDSFVSASNADIPIAFDIDPAPVSGALPDFSGPAVKLFDIFALEEAADDRLLFQASSGGTDPSFSKVRGMLAFSVDVPDIPLTVWDFYDLASLPVVISQDAALFTLRGFLTSGGDLPGDFNGNGILDVEDIDLLHKNIFLGSSEAKFDLDGDGRVDGYLDPRYWLRQLKNTDFGDADLDGDFDSSDLVAVLAAGQYRDDIELNSTWSTGDWNGDLEFDSFDLVRAFTAGLSPEWHLAVASVPEPTASGLFLFGLIAVVSRGISLDRRR